MDASGLNQLCEQCGTRLSRCKGRLYKRDPGRICQFCFDKQRRGAHRPAEAAPTSSPHRSHKRRAQSDPGEFRAALAAATAPPSPVACSLFAHSRWATHQCRISSGSRRTRTLALSWLALLASGELRDWEEKRGGFWQHVTHKQLHCSYEDDRRRAAAAGRRAAAIPSWSQGLTSPACTWYVRCRPHARATLTTARHGEGRRTRNAGTLSL